MATPLPPERWTRVRIGYGGTEHPEEANQLRLLRQEARKRWEEAAQIAPRVRAYKARLEEEWLPSMDAAIAEAVAAVAAATGRLMLRVVAEQGNQVLEVGGQDAIFLSAEDQQNDPDLVVAETRLKALRDGRRRLLERLDEANQHLAIVDYQRPPAEE